MTKKPIHLKRTQTEYLIVKVKSELIYKILIFDKISIDKDGIQNQR
jgi:hypothetical protein